MAENETTLNLLVIGNVNFDLYVLSWSGVLDWPALAVAKRENLGWNSVWHDGELVS